MTSCRLLAQTHIIPGRRLTYVRDISIQTREGVKQLATKDDIAEMFQRFHLAAQTEERTSIFMVNFDRDRKTLVQRGHIYDDISKCFDSGNRVALWGLGGVG